MRTFISLFNGEKKVDFEEQCCFVEFEKSKDGIRYAFTDLTELSLAYAITVHKSQGSEFDVVIIPVASQHFKMLFRNLIYTGLTRAKKLCVFVGSRKALALAVKHVENQLRQTALKQLLQ